MKPHFIKKGTTLEIEVVANNPDSGVGFSGKFHEARGDAVLIKSDDIFEYCEKQPAGLRLHISFIQDQHKCDFYGRLERTLTIYSGKFIEVLPVSSIDIKSRRSTFRHKLNVEITLNVIDDGGAEDFVCVGQIEDISTDAVSFMSNTDVAVSENSRFTLDFIMFERSHFKLPAILLRKNKASTASRYRYNYVFLFDFSENKEECNRLAYLFFENAIKSVNKP